MAGTRGKTDMMTVSAPAKVNLSLRILGKRPDGYHTLESVMQMLALADTLTISEADALYFTCSNPALESADNLVMRAAQLLQGISPHSLGARMHLEKQIPVQAGLGGGSSDAAAALAALNVLWDIRLPLDKLATLAATLGSDIPFFLNGPCALVCGRGETVYPVVHQTPGHVVLVKPSAGLSTPRVYADLHADLLTESSQTGQLPETMALLQALNSGNIEAVAHTICNDLEASALTLLPELTNLRARMLQAGCLAVILCGSGSTLCGICDSSSRSLTIASMLANDGLWTWAGDWLLPTDNS